LVRDIGLTPITIVYPFRGAPFTTLGVTYQQALQNYIEDGLGGLITAAQYPFDGQDRIFPVP
jgi:5'-nucleotidase